MAFRRCHIKISDSWLTELEQAAQHKDQIASFEVLNLIAHLRAMKHDRDHVIEEMENFQRGVPPLTVPSDAERRAAWAKLGWIVA